MAKLFCSFCTGKNKEKPDTTVRRKASTLTGLDKKSFVLCERSLTSVSKYIAVHADAREMGRIETTQTVAFCRGLCARRETRFWRVCEVVHDPAPPLATGQGRAEQKLISYSCAQNGVGDAPLPPRRAAPAVAASPLLQWRERATVLLRLCAARLPGRAGRASRDLLNRSLPRTTTDFGFNNHCVSSDFWVAHKSVWWLRTTSDEI